MRKLRILTLEKEDQRKAEGAGDQQTIYTLRTHVEETDQKIQDIAEYITYIKSGKKNPEKRR